jgi:creatinine amidohydrolase
VALFPGREDWNRARADAGLVTTAHDDMHAGELETSILLHAYPHVVRDGNPTADHDASDRPHLLTLGMRAYTQTGVIGRPSLGTPAKGKAILESLVGSFKNHLELLRGSR